MWRSIRRLHRDRQADLSCDPTYLVDGVIHYCVTNMPGAVPRTSTLALSNVTLPYGLQLADLGLKEAATRDDALAKGVNVLHGKVTYQAVADAFKLPFTPRKPCCRIDTSEGDLIHNHGSVCRAWIDLGVWGNR